jgi:NitT/TauT family transport system substrate-binding protein
MTVVGISALMLAGACTGDDGSDDNETGNGEPDQVTYVTGFGLFGRDMWIACIEEQGYFADRNIELQIEPGTGTEGNFALLLGGQADFVITDMVGNLIALGDGTTGWKAVGAIQQSNLSTWMSLDPELETVQDLEGRTVAVPPGAVTGLLFPTYAELSGANPDEITLEPVDGPDLPGALVSGNVDAIGQFATGLPGIEAAAEGQEVFVHPYGDVLTDLYGQALVTTDELIASNPDLVTRFREALIEGLAWSFDNWEQCGEIMGGIEEVVQPPPVAGREVALMDPYARVGNTPLGHFDEQRVARMIATLEAAGAIPAGITPDQVIDFGFVPQA